MLKEFREFAMRGNVVDLAVGLILGAAFGAIVTSFVNDVIMPPSRHAARRRGLREPVRPAQGRREGRRRRTPASPIAKAAGAITLNIGVFINTIINFVFVALSMFVLVKGMNAARRTTPPPPAEPPPQERLLAEIRDLLKAREHDDAGAEAPAYVRRATGLRTESDRLTEDRRQTVGRGFSPGN